MIDIKNINAADDKTSIDKNISTKCIDKLHSILSFYFIRFCCTRLNVPLLLLHTAHSTVLLYKLTSSQLVNKSPAFYGTGRFITAFTSAHHLSLT